MKVGITGALHFINRMYEACGTFQWARECQMNAQEAGATRVEFGIEWQAVAKHNVYRRTIADDGAGMDQTELLKFFSNLGAGGKPIGGVHDNFGVGAKVSTLPWNPEGVIVISYKAGRGSMIWIKHDTTTAEYELVTFTIGGKKACVVEPGTIADINWGQVRPEWIKDHGTVVVLLGSEENPDTVLGNPQADEGKPKGLSAYLNTRFWKLNGVDVRVIELPGKDKTQWPRTKDERDAHRQVKTREIKGAHHYVSLFKTPAGKLQTTNNLKIANKRVSVTCYVWKGDRPKIASIAKKGGYFALRYKDELFQVTSSKSAFRSFGVSHHAVQQNLTIIIEPQLYEADGDGWGVYPDQSRSRLLFTGDSERGTEVPLEDWGLEFIKRMPKAISEAIRAARADLAASIGGDEYRHRLQEKFGHRWGVTGLVQAKNGDRNAIPSTATGEQVMVYERTGSPGDQDKVNSKPPQRARRSAVHGGVDAGVEIDVAVDVPRYRLASAKDFDEPWHAAVWAPHDADGPTVFVNIESPIIRKAVEYHQSQYPAIYAEEVQRVIYQTFGEIAACKLAHSQQLASTVPAEKLDRDYRNASAFTFAMMGLLAEDTLITHRLSKLGPKIPTTGGRKSNRSYRPTAVDRKGK